MLSMCTNRTRVLTLGLRWGHCVEVYVRAHLAAISSSTWGQVKERSPLLRTLCMNRRSMLILGLRWGNCVEVHERGTLGRDLESGLYHSLCLCSHRLLRGRWALRGEDLPRS